MSARKPAAFLTPYTKAELEQREAVRRSAEAQAQQQAAAPSPAGFVLCGSDRAGDLGAAHGQKEIF